MEDGAEEIKGKAENRLCYNLKDESMVPVSRRVDADVMFRFL